MRKRPFLLLFCVCVCGVLCVLVQPAFALLFAAIYGYAAPWREQGVRKILFAAGIPLLFLTGLLTAQGELAFRQQYLDGLSDGQTVCVSGKLVRAEKKTSCVYWYLTDCAVQLSGGQTACNDVIAYASFSDQASIGQTLVINGTITLFTERSCEGMFDARAFYRSQKIDFGVWVQELVQRQGTADRYRTALFALRERLGEGIAACIDDDGVLSAMLLGDKHLLDEDIKSLYQKSGVSHILAISGLHVSLLFLGLYRLLRRLTLPQAPAALVTAAGLLSFAVMTGNSASTQRAAAMCLLYLLSDVIGYEYDMLNALGVAALSMLLENPFLVGYSGFLLSVLAIVAIGAGGAVFTQWRRLFVRKKRGFFERRREGLWVSLAIQLFTVPVIAYQYYEIPVYAMLVNLFVLAFVEYLLGLAVLGAVTALWFPAAAKIIFAPCALLLRFNRFCCSASLALPGALFVCGQPTTGQLVFYYAGLAALLWGMYAAVRRARRRERVKKRRRLPAGLRFLTTLSVLFLVLFFPKQKEFEIDFLDVGQGDGIYLCTGGGVPVFFDGGSTDTDRVGTYRILPFLKAKGVDHIEYWFISHTDADHISGLQEVLESGYPVRHLFFAEAAREDAKELAALAESVGTRVHYLQTGDTLCSGAAVFRCLYPERTDESEDVNELCLVMEYKEQDVRALFAGDISAEVEEMLIARGVCETVQIFKADHHGSRYANSSAFLALLKPQICVASAGKNNRYNHPHPDAVTRIAESGSLFYCTAESGRVRIVLDNKRLVGTGWEKDP